MEQTDRDVQNAAILYDVWMAELQNEEDYFTLYGILFRNLPSDKFAEYKRWESPALYDNFTGEMVAIGPELSLNTRFSCAFEYLQEFVPAIATALRFE